MWSPVADHQLAPSEAEGSLHYDMSLPANLASPLEYVVTKNAPVSALESVLTKTKDLNFLGINTYKKQGVAPPLLLPLPLLSPLPPLLRGRGRNPRAARRVSGMVGGCGLPLPGHRVKSFRGEV